MLLEYVKKKKKKNAGKRKERKEKNEIGKRQEGKREREWQAEGLRLIRLEGFK